MEESILLTVRKLIGPSADYEVFDTDLIVHINAFFEVLTQCGVGPDEGFIVSGEAETWTDFISDPKLLPMVKDYITIRTRLTFDPPSSSFAMDSLKKTADELEWRMYIKAELNKRLA